MAPRRFAPNATVDAGNTDAGKFESDPLPPGAGDNGSNVPDEDAQMLRTVCTAAAAELEGRLRRGVSSDDMTELFTTAAGMLAISMYMELGSAHSGGVSGFTAGRLSVQLGGASAAALRKSAETMLGAYLDTGGFEFMGVQG